MVSYVGGNRVFRDQGEPSRQKQKYATYSYAHWSCLTPEIYIILLLLLKQGRETNGFESRTPSFPTPLAIKQRLVTLSVCSSVSSLALLQKKRTQDFEKLLVIA